VTRVGWGFDAHRFGIGGPLRLCGVEVDADRSLEGTSDGDVALHAVIDALLGAAALGDIGELFPSSDPRWANADSAAMTRTTVQTLREEAFVVAGVDVTVISESVLVAPYRLQMRRNLAELLEIGISAVSVKATSTDGLGFTGRDEGVAATAVVSLLDRD
jgi:2-C-methyl-D-erythritol 2,4-cyclodiphosphate synthase